MSEQLQAQKKRKITVIFTQEGKKQVIENTDIKTFAELKNKLTISSSSKKFTDRASRMTLENDTALLPQGDAVIFATPVSSKLGADLTASAVKKMANNNLRRKVRQLVEKGLMPKSVLKMDTKAQANALIQRLDKINKATAKPVKKAAKPVKATKKAKAVTPAKKKAVGKVVKSLRDKDDISVEDAIKEARAMGLRTS